MSLTECGYSAKQRSFFSSWRGDFVNSSPDDVSRVIRLVREVCDRWDEPAAWRRHLLQGACSLLEGNVGMIVADRSPSITAFGRPFVISVVGVPSTLLPSVSQAISQFENRGYEECAEDVMPGIAALHSELNGQGWVTASRDQFTSPNEFHSAQS